MKKFYFLIIILISGWAGNTVKAQYLILKFQDGTEETREISLLQSLQFPENLLQINFLSGSAETYDLSTISTLYLRQYPLAADDYSLTSDQEILIYPNPASDVIYLKNAPEAGSLVSIYRIDGALISQKQISSQNQALDISGLTNGLYILRIDNQAIKFIKQ